MIDVFSHRMMTGQGIHTIAHRRIWLSTDCDRYYPIAAQLRLIAQNVWCISISLSRFSPEKAQKSNYNICAFVTPVKHPQFTQLCTQMRLKLSPRGTAISMQPTTMNPMIRQACNRNHWFGNPYSSAPSQSSSTLSLSHSFGTSKLPLYIQLCCAHRVMLLLRFNHIISLSCCGLW